jgi:hypothetical protein
VNYQHLEALKSQQVARWRSDKAIMRSHLYPVLVLDADADKARCRGFGPSTNSALDKDTHEDTQVDKGLWRLSDMP